MASAFGGGSVIYDYKIYVSEPDQGSTFAFIRDTLRGREIAELKLSNSLPIIGSPNWLLSFNLKRAEGWARRRCELLNKAMA